MRRRISPESMKEQIEELAVEWDRDDLTWYEVDKGEIHVAWKKPIKFALPRAGFSILDELIIPFGEPTHDWNLTKIMNQRLRQHEKKRWFLQFELRKAKKKKETLDAIEEARLEFKKDFKNLGKIRVCL